MEQPYLTLVRTKSAVFGSWLWLSACAAIQADLWRLDLYICAVQRPISGGPRVRTHKYTHMRTWPIALIHAKQREIGHALLVTCAHRQIDAAASERLHALTYRTRGSDAAAAAARRALLNILCLIMRQKKPPSRSEHQDDGEQTARGVVDVVGERCRTQ